MGRPAMEQARRMPPPRRLSVPEGKDGPMADHAGQPVRGLGGSMLVLLLGGMCLLLQQVPIRYRSISSAKSPTPP